MEDIFLGIDGGGTGTVAVAVDRQLRLLARAEFGPGNIRLLTEQSLKKLFSEIAGMGLSPAAVGIGMAGLRNEADKRLVQKVSEVMWGAAPVVITHDLEIALAAGRPANVTAQVLVLSGTGSCCFGKNEAGKSEKVGGWGHLLGDLGSGYDIALSAVRAVVYEYDRNEKWSSLSRSVLRSLLLNSPDDLIGWAQRSEKAVIARLAPVVMKAADEGDGLAKEIISQAAEKLARDAITCSNRLASARENVGFILAGSVLEKQPTFAKKVATLIRMNRPKATVQPLDCEPAFGAAKLAIEAFRKPSKLKPSRARQTERYFPHFAAERSPTEQRNPKSLSLDRLQIGGAVDLMLDAEREVIPALEREKPQLERLVRAASTALSSGGRIFYVGAGTSGRLGVLDASECPPTFRASPELVQGIIAGGQTALWQAVEGAEDDWNAGAAAIRFREVSKRDFVLGIAASGRTPFVWGALAEARKRDAATGLLCFNPHLEIDRKHRPDLVVAPDLGPEILTGSTRLKCGTATKLVLNMVSTLSMVRLGKVVSNLMVDLNPSNVKLRDRAERIVCELTGCSPSEAKSALERNGWIVKKAWEDLKKKNGAKSSRPTSRLRNQKL